MPDSELISKTTLSGNTTKDANGRTSVYDAENKQVDVKNASNETIGKYWYDGDGRRVKKRGWINGQWEETIFVYDASSRLVAEYSTILNPTPQVAYLTNDHLGSPRLNTDENGAVISRNDYRPYGEEVAERTHTQYVGDAIRKQFTGYERDTESDLDFAQARYFISTLGRFSSPDPYNVLFEKEKQGSSLRKERTLDSYLSRPQKWNRHVYVVNNPLKFTDPTGLSEQGGTTVKHPNKGRAWETNGDQILTVTIATTPANPMNRTGDEGQEVFRYDTLVTVTDENGDVIPSESTLFYFNQRGQRSQNFDLVSGEPTTIVEEVDVDNEGISEPEPRSVTLEVNGQKKEIDYEVQNVGNTAQVVQGSYDNKITIPSIDRKPTETFIRIDRPDPIVEAMRPRRPGTTLVLNGY